MKSKYLPRIIALGSAVLILSVAVNAQSGASRPRRVNPQQPASSPDGARQPARTSRQSADSPLLTPINATATPTTTTNGTTTSATTTSRADTAHAYTLLQQKQYAAAAGEAKQLTASNPEDSEAWKIAGFAEYNLKQYEEAASDLQRALDLQRAAGSEDANTVDALGQAYVLTEKFEQALPLLVNATSRKGATPDGALLYYRGVAEYRTGKGTDAERSFNAAVKANPKDAASLYYLGQLAYARNDLDAAISALNRSTLIDARVAPAWALLTTSYLRRAAAATVPAKADADYLSAVRAGESLNRLKTDADTATLFGQALIGAKQYPRAAMVLERAAGANDARGVTLYLLGVAYSRSKNFPKAIAALERAAAKTPDDVNTYRELGYAYEISKQYAKALAAYEKGLSLAPGDADFKESAERVRPFAK
ncbi:MAG TPA: tetratricopeptide repeat protein [Pyrinomonadaceae bacterium]|jgi:tetratricopeptide (TPR) repeat protein|nr:tetratricopeptide repeat protein [Pyrinomonadaceae bacterium]